MESIFECGICYKQYNHCEKKPTSLPCGHTFCLACLKKVYKHSAVKCPYDSVSHHTTPENLPVNYQLLTALPMGEQKGDDDQEHGQQAAGVKFCEIHPNKKVKFYCKNDKSMFCSKCILKHNEMRHEIIQISPKVEEMQKMVEDLAQEVDKVE
jgi:hypothetical protein